MNLKKLFPFRYFVSKPLQIFFYLASVLSLSCCLLVGVLLLNPKIVLNEKVLTWAAPLAQAKGFKIHWQKLHIDVDNLSILKKKVSLNIQGLCVEKLEFEGCVQRLQGSIIANLSGLEFHLEGLGPLDLDDLQWKLFSGKTVIQGNLDLHAAGELNDQLANGGQWQVHLQGDAQLPDRMRVSTQSDIQIGFKVSRSSLRRPKADFKITASLTKNRGSLQAEVRGSADELHLRGHLDAELSQWVPEIKKIKTEGCNFTLNRLSKSHSQSLVQMICPLVFATPQPSEAWIAERIPSEIGLTLFANLTMSTWIPGPETRLSGTAKVQLDPISTDLFEGAGKIDMDLANGVIREFPRMWEIHTRSSLTLDIPQFHHLVENLRTTPWAIPAPFHVLRGSVRLAVVGQSNLITGEFPFRLKTQLASNHQNLRSSCEGRFILSKIFTKPELGLEVDLVLSEVQLELPRLELGTPPRFFPDPRIQKANAQEIDQGATSFKYLITIHTLPHHPVLVLSNLAKEKIPVELHLTLTETGLLTGTVRVDSFPVEIFHRKARVKFFQMTLKSPMNESPISGLVDVEYTDYRLFIQLNATIDKPQITLKSEPALAENQLVAVLLYGRPLDELNTDESSSVGNTRAAIADQALGLASLYALASTPVQSLGYDPTTGVVSAKLKIAEGTSLNLGTNAKESAIVGIQKRLGKNWTIQTDLGTSETSRGMAAAYLQWSSRY